MGGGGKVGETKGDGKLLRQTSLFQPYSVLKDTWMPAPGLLLSRLYHHVVKLGATHRVSLLCTGKLGEGQVLIYYTGTDLAAHRG